MSEEKKQPEIPGSPGVSAEDPPGATEPAVAGVDTPRLSRSTQNVASAEMPAV